MTMPLAASPRTIRTTNQGNLRRGRSPAWTGGAVAPGAGAATSAGGESGLDVIVASAVFVAETWLLVAGGGLGQAGGGSGGLSTIRDGWRWVKDGGCWARPVTAFRSRSCLNAAANECRSSMLRLRFAR